MNVVNKPTPHLHLKTRTPIITRTGPEIKEKKVPVLKNIYLSRIQEMLIFENSKSDLFFIPNPVLTTLGISFSRNNGAGKIGHPASSIPIQIYTLIIIMNKIGYIK